MDISVRYELTADQRETLSGAYGDTWFGDDWDRDTVDSLLAGTDVLVALCDDTDELLAFAHVLTDETTVAFVRDVVVRENYRGQGLGRRLVAELAAHPELPESVTLSVTCPTNLVGFYEACGFEPRSDGAILVRQRA